MSNALTGVTIAELHEQIKQIQHEIESRKSSTKANLRGEIEQRLREVDLTIFDIFPELNKTERPRNNVPKVRADVQPKYKDPDSEETWSGRGRSPKWVVAILQAKNISIEQFKSSDAYHISS
jgi:DNA-binding protein H-NS